MRRTPQGDSCSNTPSISTLALAPVLSEAVVNEMSCVGSLLIIGIALNVLNLTKLKLANYLPAIFLPILLCRVM